MQDELITPILLLHECTGEEFFLPVTDNDLGKYILSTYPDASGIGGSGYDGSKQVASLHAKKKNISTCLTL